MFYINTRKIKWFILCSVCIRFQEYFSTNINWFVRQFLSLNFEFFYFAFKQLNLSTKRFRDVLLFCMQSTKTTRKLITFVRHCSRIFLSSLFASFFFYHFSIWFTKINHSWFYIFCLSIITQNFFSFIRIKLLIY